MEQTLLQNTYVRVVLVLLSLFLLVAAVGKGVAAYQELNDTSKQNTLTISAVGELDSSPDVANCSLGVITEGTDPKVIQDENSAKINKITAFLAGNGVEEKDITTSNYNLSPRYNWPDGKQVLEGYTLSQTVNIKIRDLTKVGDILKGVVENGANNVNNLTFAIDDPEGLKQQARKLALENAKSKAGELAGVAGVKLGKVVNFSENTVLPSDSYYAYESAYGVGGGAGGGSPDIKPGSTTVTATVSVTFELK